MTRLLSLSLFLVATLGPARAISGQAPTASANTPGPIDDYALAAARCTTCHLAAPRVAALPSPALDALGDRLARPWLETSLVGHARLTKREAADIAALLTERRTVGAEPVRVSASDIARGETLWRTLGCTICHAQGGIPDLAAKTWVGAVTEFLLAPGKWRPDVRSHEFDLSQSDAQALAAFLVRGSAPDTPALEPGLFVECFELKIASPEEPELEGLTPARTGYAQHVDVKPRSRDNDFALRFTGFLNVPATGEWTFTVGSDDASWLWIDGQNVVRNEAIAPYRKVRGKVTLDAGWHAILIVMTEAGGGEALDVSWRGPGVPLQELPPAALASRFVELPMLPATPPLDDATRARGTALFAAKHCAACHEVGAPQVVAPKWVDLPRTGDCAMVPVPEALRGRVGLAPTGGRSASAELAFQLQRDGCVRCHAHAGAGGVSATARTTLTEREDLGEEARVPPDLTHAGARLRPTWIESVLRGDARARPYLTMAKPHLAADAAARWAELFAGADEAAADAPPTVDDAHVAEGRHLAGTAGLACIACHAVAGRRSIGPQGMDLAQQVDRLRPAWMREWLLAPNKHRPGTRMPTYFPADTPEARAKVEGLVAWLSLGRSMPLPLGLVTDASAWRLDAIDRPRLHGAFLKGLSARCIAVATPARVNSAYDLAHARLAWLWRGDFLDTSGTWEGRAGRLLEPLGQDHVVLGLDGGLRSLSADDPPPRSLGWRVDDDGYPIFRVQVGKATVEDTLRPRIAVGGAHFVRRLSVTGGTVRFEPGELAAGLTLEPAGPFEIRAGETKEVTYRW